MAIIANGILTRAAELLSPDFTHMAVGNGTSVTEISTSLNSEIARKATTGFIDGNTLIKEIFFDTTELNNTPITTTGLFGKGATITANSGVLMSGDNVSITKTELESLTISYEITINRG